MPMKLRLAVKNNLKMNARATHSANGNFQLLLALLQPPLVLTYIARPKTQLTLIIFKVVLQMLTKPHVN
jgi:hypothetical protein